MLNILPTVCNFSRHPNSSLQIACVRILGNFMGGTLPQTTHALELGPINVFYEFLSSPNYEIRKESVRALRLLTLSCKKHCELVMGLTDITDMLLRMTYEEE